jgi:Leucine-rich repeat (LRR) protein
MIIRKLKISSQILVLVMLLLISCNNNNNQTESKKAIPLKSKKLNTRNKSDEESNYITKDSIFYLMKFDQLEIDSSGHFSIANKRYNILDVTKVRLGIDSEEKWKKELFPTKILEFKNLEYLWIGMRGFKELPVEIKELTKLKHLDLQHSNIMELPIEISELKNIERLTLLWSNISELPSGFHKLSNLKYLHLGCTQLEKLPTELFKMINLETLIISHDDECQEKRQVFMQKDIDELKNRLTNTKLHIGRIKPVTNK